MTQQLYDYNTTRGDGLIEILCSLLSKQAAKQVFLVRGKHSFVSCGAQEVLHKVQDLTGVHFIEFMDFSPNPKDAEALVGLQVVLETHPDMILAIGGGSVLDMAKLIRHYAAEQGIAFPLWAIPTTSGTGAEATHFAVVYREGKKCSIEADDILPDVVFLYPPFTYKNDAYLTACTGFDALAQSIEAYWAKGANEESRTYSLKALGLLWEQLPQLAQSPSEELRDQVAEGAYWAGRAINISKTTAPHAFSYEFTSHYGYPHGHAVALTFPFFMRLNGTEELYRVVGVAPNDAMRKMEEYIVSLGLSLQLSPDIDIPATLQQVNMQRLGNNPVNVTSDIVKELELYLKER